MTINQKKSLVAFYISKYNSVAFEKLGYSGSMTSAMEDLSIRITGPNCVPNAYIKQRRDEFDVFFENGRAGYRNRKPTPSVIEMYNQWNTMSFEKISELVLAMLDGNLEESEKLDFACGVEDISEIELERYINFEDETACISRKVKEIIERTYSKKKVDMLKRLYAYKCQICGKNVGEEYSAEFAEVHHINYFSESADNSSNNLLVLCPNHHSVIHKLNPRYDAEEMQYVYPNGKIDKIILDFHLSCVREE